MIRMISKEDVFAKAANADVITFVEIGENIENFTRSHIVDSKFVPLNRIRELAPLFLPDRSAEIVVYAEKSEPNDPALLGARELDSLGYVNLYYLIGGKNDWYWGSYPVNAVHRPPK